MQPCATCGQHLSGFPISKHYIQSSSPYKKKLQVQTMITCSVVHFLLFYPDKSLQYGEICILPFFGISKWFPFASNILHFCSNKQAVTTKQFCTSLWKVISKYQYFLSLHRDTASLQGSSVHGHNSWTKGRNLSIPIRL